MTFIFSIHYFLWYGALTSIFGYESVYARHYTNASPIVYGYLNMVLPFATVIVTPIICSLADRQRSHRSFFTLSLVFTTITLSLYAMLPLIMGSNILGKDAEHRNHDSQQPTSGQLNLGPWIYFCINSLICCLSMGVNTCLSDSFAVSQAEEHGTSFGKIIVWGTFGWAASALVLGFINQWGALPRLMPGIIFGTVLLAIDVIVVSFWPRASDFKLDMEASSSGDGSQKLTTSLRKQLLLLGIIMMRRKALIRFLILFILSGFFMSMHWNFFFLYLERIYYEKFELISALSMVGQSICGELPFFILSSKVIDLFGRSHTLSISLISIGIRFLIYAYMLPNVNMYFIIVADCFQGPNYGLFYVVMTEVGLEYSYCNDDTIEHLVTRGEIDRNNTQQVENVRLSVRSTVQSVAFACYEGIGVGLGSVAGGWILSSFGFRVLWVSAAIGSLSVGLLNVVIELLCHDPEVPPLSERREFMEARRKGALKKVVSLQPFCPAIGAKTRQETPQRDLTTMLIRES